MGESTEGRVASEVKREESSRFDAVKNHWAVRLVAVLLLPVVSSLAAYKTADGTGVYAKNAAESGFQEIRIAFDKQTAEVTRLSSLVAELRDEVDELKRRPRVVLSKKARAAQPPPSPPQAVPSIPPPAVPELPKNLDEALALQQAKQQEQKKAAETAPAAPPK